MNKDKNDKNSYTAMLSHNDFIENNGVNLEDDEDIVKQEVSNTDYNAFKEDAYPTRKMTFNKIRYV